MKLHPTFTGLLSVVAVLAIPAGVQAAHPSATKAHQVSGTVLQIDSRHHVLRIAESNKRVDSFRYRGRIDTRVRPGVLVRVSAKRHDASRVTFVARSRTARFMGRVLASTSRGLTLSLPDGRPITLTPRGITDGSARAATAHSAQNVSLSFAGLQPGQTVQVTITYSDNGDIAISITLMADPSSGGSSSGDQPPPVDGGNGDTHPSECVGPDAGTGRVEGINRETGVFTISEGWGQEQTFTASPELLAHIHELDQVLVRFAAADPSTATDVRIINSDVTPADPDVITADGTVNRVSTDAGQVTVIQSNHSGRLTLNTPCWAINAVWTSEDVHVVYHKVASGDLVLDTVSANDGSEF